MKTKFLLFLFCFLLISSPSYSAILNVYVDQTLGNDTTGTGTVLLPYKTLAKVYAIKSTLDPGSTVYFKCGETWRESLNAKQPGSSGLPITYTSYGSGEKPIISGAEYFDENWTLVSGTIYSHPLDMSLVTDAAPTRVWQQGNNELTYDSGHFATLDMWEYDYVGGATDLFYVNLGHKPTTNEVEYTYRTNVVSMNASYNTLDGITITKGNGTNLSQYDYQVDYVVIKNCNIENSGKNGIATRMSATINADNWTLQNNNIRFNGSPAYAGAPHGIYPEFGDGWLIEHNNIYSNHRGVLSGGGVRQSFCMTMKDMTNCIIRYNYFYDQYGGAIELAENQAVNGGTGSTNNQIYYNVSINCRRFVYSNSDDSTVHQNTGNVVYNNVAVYYHPTVNGYAAINIGDAGLYDLTVKNNIFWYKTGKPYWFESGAGPTAMDYNCVGPEASDFIKWNGTNYHTLASYIAVASTCDAHSFATNPSLQSEWPTGALDCKLKTGSPCIDAGTDVSLVLDYWGDTVPENTLPDIGVHEMEYSGGGDIPPPDYSGDFSYWGIWNRWQKWRGEWK